MAVVTEGTLRITQQRNVAVAAWRDAPTVAQFRVFEREGRAMTRRYPKGAALFNVVLSGKPDFSSEVRAETARINGLGDIFVLGAAHVILVTGLVGAAVRAYLSTSMLVTRPVTPTKVFGEKRPAAEWLLERLTTSGETWSVDQLVQLVDSG